jgi:hypothetical protein
MRRGPFFTFLEHAISILASGNDDQIRSLFDRQTPEEVDMLFSTTNDRLELELLRQAMRKAHLGQAWIIEGKSTQYLLFSLDAPRTQQPTSTATPPSLPDQKPSVYAFRCSRSSNDILLTGQGSEVSTTVESVLNNGGGALLTPSDACRDLVRRQLNMQQQ